MSEHNRINLVGRTVALVVVAQWTVFQVMLRNWDRIEVAARFFLGNDFADLYTAAGYVLSGTSPYADRNIITPPPSLLLPIALHHLPFWIASTAFRTINFVLVITALLWLGRQLRLNELNTALLIATALTYGPFYSILAGGNLDGIMLVLLVFACGRKTAWRGAFLGLSIATKVYSVLMLPVLFLHRRWREIIWAVAVVGLLLLPFVGYLPDFVTNLLHRSARLRLQGNQSPAVLFILLFGENHAWLWRTCYGLLWGGTLAVKMASDWVHRRNTEDERFLVLEYLPWMAGAPQLVFTYTATILLPVMALLIRENQQKRLSIAEWTLAGGFILTALYPTLISQLLSQLFTFGQVATTVATVIPPLGVSTMLLASTAIALSAWRTERPAEAKSAATS